MLEIKHKDEAVPRFTGWQLSGAALVLVVVGGLVAWCVCRSSAASLLTFVDGTTTKTVDSDLARRMTKLLALSGLVAVISGVWLQMAAMHKPKAPSSLAITGEGLLLAEAESAGKAIAPIVEAIAKLKEPIAVLVVGALLLVMSGFMAIRSMEIAANVVAPTTTTTTPTTATTTTTTMAATGATTTTEPLVDDSGRGTDPPPPGGDDPAQP